MCITRYNTATGTMPKKYYKVLNADLKHYDFQYKTGLNIDHVPFNPKGLCQPGGLYYTDAKNIAKFLDYGCYLANVKIPTDAKIYRELITNGSNKTIKWKADKIEIVSYCKIREHPLFRDPGWCLTTVKQDGMLIQHITHPTSRMCITAVQQDGLALMYITEQTTDICLAAVEQNGYALKYVTNKTPEICLAAVTQNGHALHYATYKTADICLAAVIQNGNALKYVAEQTEELCLAAVKQRGQALEHVKEQTADICLAAVNRVPCALEFVDAKFYTVCCELVAKNTETNIYRTLPDE